jgi:putative CocE/NonD family hydrolase
MRRSVALSLAVLAVLVLAAPAGAWTAPPARYPGVVKQQDVSITMSDGVVLHADVIHPATASGAIASGKFPVLLTQTPYNKAAPRLNFEDDYLVEHGYVQVIADVRGTGSSEGNWDSFGTREQMDGKELVGWARTQPWSNGSIGGHGTSYGAINQLLTAAQQPKGLKALFPIVPGADTYRDISASGGQLDTSFIPSWLGLVTGLGLLPPTYSASDPVEAAKVIAQHIGNVPSFQVATVLSSSTGGDDAFDGPFYRTRSPIEVIDKVKIPTFIMGGWFDLFQRGEPLLFQHLRSNHVPSELVMGPWYHITAGNGLPADGVPSADDLELRWMDHFVKGLPDAALDQQVRSRPFTYFENGQGHYHHAPSYPAPGTRAMVLHLTGNASPGTNGALTTKAASGGPDSLPWNPTTGVCSRSTAQWTAGVAAPPCETDDRVNDIYGLSYDLPVTGTPLHLLGPIDAHLFVTSLNQRDAQITARVEDVAPDGTATQLTAGWQVLSLRANDTRRSKFLDGAMVQPYHPFTKTSVLPIDDGAMPVDVEIFPTGSEIAPGHTLRLTIQPADAPHLTAPLPQALDSAGGVLGIVHDAAHPSSLNLSVAG